MNEKLKNYLDSRIEELLTVINDDSKGDMELFLAGVVAFTAKLNTEAFRKGFDMNEARPR